MRRPAIAILICLTLGLAATVVTAWAIALYASGPARGGPPGGDLPPAAWPRHVPGHWNSPDFARTKFSTGITRRQVFTGYRAGDYLTTAGFEINQSGWPVRCLEWERWFDRQEFRVPPRETLAAYWLRDGLAPPRWLPTADGADWRRLPIEPVWPGFAANTLFYAGLFGLIGPLPRAVRRMRRRRLGLCERCAYPQGVAAVCSECGLPLVRP